MISAAGSGGGTSAACGDASAATARAHALSALRGLYQHIHVAHVGTAGGVGGFYAQCITNNSRSELCYDGSIDTCIPLTGRSARTHTSSS